jgi:L-fucose isomerase-like protein
LESHRKRGIICAAYVQDELPSGLNEQIAFVPLASPLDDPRSVEEVISKYRDRLAGYFDCEIRPTPKFELEEDQRINATVGVLALVVTGGTEPLIQHLVDLGKPTMILAHESLNSLPAALEALSSLREGPRPRLVVTRAAADLEQVQQFATAAKAVARISGYRLGIIGGPSPSLTYSQPDSEKLLQRLGIRLIQLPMDELRSAYEGASEPLIVSLAAEIKSKEDSSKQITSDDSRKSSAIYVAMKKIAEEHNLNAMTVRCFDLIEEYKTTGCYAVAKLNDGGFVAGCEGDVPAVVAMIILSEISESPTFLANASFVEGRKITLAHCTIAPRLTTDYRYDTHFESGLGISIAGALKLGERVTLLRLSKELDRLRVGEGTIVKGEAWSEKLCRTQVEIELDGNAEIIKNAPLGNHHVVAYGEHVEMLKTFAAFAGMHFEEI